MPDELISSAANLSMGLCKQPRKATSPTRNRHCALDPAVAIASLFEGNFSGLFSDKLTEAVQKQENPRQKKQQKRWERTTKSR